MNKETVKKYLKKPYACPKCGSEDIVDGEFIYDWDEITSEVCCNGCEFAWTNVYKLNTIME